MDRNAAPAVCSDKLYDGLQSMPEEVKSEN
jgi:hypothetical protein